MALVLLVVCTLYIVSRAAYRADKEATAIQMAVTPLGFWWHVEQWFTGKAGTGVICVLFYGLATGIYGAVTMAFYSMFLYWLCFDFFLNFERCLPAWYISQGKETALSDKLLRWVQGITGLTDQQTHLWVKIPLILLAFVGCILVAF